MTVTTIILSKDRPAQLDLLLRSLDRNGGSCFDRPRVIWKGVGYDYIRATPRTVGRARNVEDDGNFEQRVRFYLGSAGEFVCFMCDDGILYRKVVPLDWFDADDVLCFSLRLGQNTTICYPSGLTQHPPADGCWDWTRRNKEPGLDDFGYPGSIDGHVFRTADVRRMLEGKSFPNPTALECALVAGCDELAAERPLMACYPHSVYVGNPVNRVSEQSGVRFGTRFPVTAAECRERFGRGERIDLDALDFSQVNGAHTEIELKWR